MSRAESAERRHFNLLVKPIGPACNLDCSYCFYLEKKALFPGARSLRMPDDVLERLVRDYIDAQPEGVPEVGFAWQGGEPTLLGLSFFRRVVELQAQHAPPGMKVTHSLQTNGTLLDDDWGRFLREHEFLVGLSIDGPERVHDRHRLDRSGAGSFGAVMRGLEVLKRHEVEFNTLTVVHRDSAGDPGRLYDFLKGIGSRFLQLIPLVEHSGLLEAKREQRPIQPARQVDGTAVGARSVEPRQWGRFLCGIFDHWLASDDVGRVFVQHFDMVLAILMGRPASLCVHGQTCGRCVALEHNGDLYSCDHYVSPEFRLGNICETPLSELVDGSFQRAFGAAKRERLPRRCSECRYLELCGGACPKDRIARTPDGEPGLAWLCRGYEMFYRHSLPTFEKMAECLRLGRPAFEYDRLEQLRARSVRPRPGSSTTSRGETRVGRNAPCTCGSGEKYKRCCGRAR